MKSMNEVLSSVKGEGNENETLTGKHPFSQSTFEDLVKAAVNDNSYKVPTYDPKTGEKTGEMSIAEKMRADLQKTLANAKYPQKSEAAVLNNVEICTKGLSEVLPYIVMEALKTGKKLPLPPQPDMTASLYLVDVPAKSKNVKARNPQTQEELGTYCVETAKHKEVRAQSPAPDYLRKSTKV